MYDALICEHHEYGHDLFTYLHVNLESLKYFTESEEKCLD